MTDKMTQPSANPVQFGFRKPTYCRKDKSIGLLCSNFMSLYDREGGDTIGIHDACARLGVDKRRLRDFLIILESIGLLKKERKNYYSWKGFGILPKTFQLLQRGGPGESYTRFEDNDSSQVLDDGKGDNLDNRKENCIGLLTQNFVKLFLSSELVISIDEAANILNGDAQDPSMIQTKVKRLYDIANVLSSMNIIEKTYQPETKRYVFRWTGLLRGQAEMTTINDPVLKTKRRTCETQPTNISNRRRKGDCRSPQQVVDENDLENGSTQNTKKHQFGPAPTNMPQDNPEGKNYGKQIPDWESLALTHRPQYQPQALRDLFGHYMGAWNFYHCEVAGKNSAKP